MSTKDQGSSYPLAHSTSIPNDAHVSRNWPTTYSRSSSISAESYYPSSEAETITKDSEDEDFDESCGSDIRPMKTYNPRYKIPGSVDIKDMIDSDSIDREKTPVMSNKSEMSTFTMDDLIKASNDLKNQDRQKAIPGYPQQLDVYPATIIQEKAIPAVAMSRRMREDNSGGDQRPPSRTGNLTETDVGRGAIRKRNRAPEPPAHDESIYETCSLSSTQSRPRSPDVSEYTSPIVSFYSEPVKAKEFGRRSELSSTAILNYPISSRNQPGAEDIKIDKSKQSAGMQHDREVGRRREANMETSVSRIDTTQPAFSYPVMKSKSSSSSYVKRTKEEKRTLIEEKKNFTQRNTGYQRTEGTFSDDDSRQHRQISTHDIPNPQTETSSNSGTCPHCKIHSWLPHSAGCPNSQHNVKRPSSSMALYRK